MEPPVTGAERTFRLQRSELDKDTLTLHVARVTTVFGGDTSVQFEIRGASDEANLWLNNAHRPDAIELEARLDHRHDRIQVDLIARGRLCKGQGFAPWVFSSLAELALSSKTLRLFNLMSGRTSEVVKEAMAQGVLLDDFPKPGWRVEGLLRAGWHQLVPGKTHGNLTIDCVRH